MPTVYYDGEKDSDLYYIGGIKSIPVNDEFTVRVNDIMVVGDIVIEGDLTIEGEVIVL